MKQSIKKCFKKILKELSKNNRTLLTVRMNNG